MNTISQDQTKKFFIGGTGRSGTTILAKMLGLHSEIYTFPKEIRFITDPDGVISLKNTLTNDWSYFQSDIALDRFLKLMHDLKRKSLGRYPTVSLAEVVGADFYNKWLNSFISEFVQFEFKSNWVARTNIFKKIVGKLFSDRLSHLAFQSSYYCQPLSNDEFFIIANSLLSEFFERSAIKNDKIHILDHTPSNVIHAEFLYKLFPEFKLLHIYRDPRDVISSYSGKEWGSNFQTQNLFWIEDILSRWDQVKQKIPNNSYYELAFENLINDTEKEIRNICDFLEVNFDKKILNLNLTNHNIGRWKDDLDSSLLKLIEESNINDKYFYKGP